MVSTQDETAEDSVATTVNGFDRLRLVDDSAVVDVIIGSLDRWDRSHLRRLRQSADLPGLVPVIDSDFASDGKPFAVVPAVDEPTLASKIPPRGRAWQECAGITEAAARALHEAHLRGLFHGALSPDQIHIINDDVAVSGVGLGLGGSPRPDYQHWVAPEVLDGVDPTERSDVYSLGKILEASLGDSLEDVPRSVRRLIMWSGSDTPEARPPSALEFASILAEALGEERRTYSPAFIPTAEANNLASTAAGAVAAHSLAPGRDRSGGPGLGAVAAGGATAAAGLGLTSPFADSGDEAAERIVEEMTPTQPDLVDEDQSVEAVMDDDSGISVIDETTVDHEPDGEDVSTSPTEIDALDSVDVLDEGVGVEGAEPDGDIAADHEQSDEALSAAAGAGLAAEAEAEAASTTQYEQDELDVGDAEIDAPRADAVDWDADAGDDGIDADEYAVPAAQTVEIENRYEPERRNNRAGILIGAIVAAGLSLIAWQLISNDDESTEVANPAATTEVEGEAEAAAPSVAEDSADTQDAATDDSVDANTVGDEVEGEDTTDTEAQAGEDTTDDPTSTDTEAGQDTTESADDGASSDGDGDEPAVDAVATVDGVLNANDAGVQIVHGIPDTAVDVYVGGEILAPGFTSGTIAGPIKLSPGQYDVAIYAATDSPSAAVADRSDDAVLSQSVSVTEDPASLYAHLDANGTPTLSAFAEEFGELSPGQSRVVVRHLAQGPEVTILIDDEPMSASEIGNGESYVLDLAAGSHTVAAGTADGAEVTRATALNLADGEVATVTVIGSVDSGTISAIVQRYSGLGSAPAGIPTGDSNLLGMDEDLTSLYLVGVLTLAMVVAGGVLMIRRNRRVL